MDRITIPSAETAKDNCEKTEPAFLCGNASDSSKPLLIEILYGNIAPFGAHEVHSRRYARGNEDSFDKIFENQIVMRDIRDVELPRIN